MAFWWVNHKQTHAKIRQIGLVEAEAVSAPKPPEFGKAGDAWGDDGWLVHINWGVLHQPLVPLNFFELLQPRFAELAGQNGEIDVSDQIDEVVREIQSSD